MSKEQIFGEKRGLTMLAPIYALIPETRLHEVLQTLNDYTQLPVELSDENGDLLKRFGHSCSYCTLLKKKVFFSGECRELHRQAGKRAQKLGESYIFSCHANLNHIAFPLQSHNQLLGNIIIGPFLMDKPDSTLVSGLAEEHHCPAGLCLELYDEIAQLQIIEPARVNHLSKLMGFLLSPLLPTEQQALRQQQERLFQQSRINETIQRYKEQMPQGNAPYAYHKERELLVKVRTGDVRAAKGILNDLLGYVLFSEGGNVEAIRNRALELTTLLSRVAIEGGAPTEGIYQLTSRFLSSCQQNETVDSLCYLLQEIVVGFTETMFVKTDEVIHPAVLKTIRYTAEHYAEPLTLQALAQVTEVSPTYLAGLCRQSLKMSFREHLNRVRVEESKLLLANTDYSLSDIAIAVGFPDHSYYTKVFKRYTGVTPKQFR